MTEKTENWLFDQVIRPANLSTTGLARATGIREKKILAVVTGDLFIPEDLAEKIVQLAPHFRKIGVNYLTDVEQLVNYPPIGVDPALLIQDKVVTTMQPQTQLPMAQWLRENQVFSLKAFRGAFRHISTKKSVLTKHLEEFGFRHRQEWFQDKNIGHVWRWDPLRSLTPHTSQRQPHKEKREQRLRGYIYHYRNDVSKWCQKVTHFKLSDLQNHLIHLEDEDVVLRRKAIHLLVVEKGAAWDAKTGSWHR